MRFYWAIFLFFFAKNVVFAQTYLWNPSFEIYDPNFMMPDTWSHCHFTSSPDVQPGFWDVTTPASDGLRYISLVTRGDNGNDNDRTTEIMGTQTIIPLDSNKCYRVNMDLKRSDQFRVMWTSPYVYFTSPVRLAVYLGDYWCNSTKLIYLSPIITDTNWNKFSFRFTPDFSSRYLTFIAQFSDSLNPQNGNICIDNINIEQMSDSVLPAVSITLPEEQVELWLSGGQVMENYTWLTNYNLNCQNCDSTLVNNVSATGSIILITNDSSYCYNQMFEIEKEVKPKPDVTIPNIMTPNNDNINDIFEIRNLQKNTSVEIYNRWGTCEFSSSDYKNDWDGRNKIKNRLVSPGIYYYMIIQQDKKQYNGYLTVIY